jgi:hypothetical protein
LFRIAAVLWMSSGVVMYSQAGMRGSSSLVCDCDVIDRRPGRVVGRATDLAECGVSAHDSAAPPA